MKKNIIFCSGGTGGHILPAISMCNYIKDESNIILLTDKRGLKFINPTNYETKILNINPLKKNNILLTIFAIIKLFLNFIYLIYFIYKKKIDIVFGFGGYVAFPILLAAKLLNKKIYLHEPNLVLGRTNKFFITSCEKIFTTSNKIINIPKKYAFKFIEVGPIIREEIINFSSKHLPENMEEKTIIILGGSQGAKIFGEIVPNAILNLIKKNKKIKIYQQVLSEQIESVKLFYNKNNIKAEIFDFNSNIFYYMHKSDLAISRSGASTIAELEFLAIPFVSIPYPFAMDNHQYQNALHYKSKEVSWILEEKNFTSLNLSNLLLEIFDNINELKVKKKKMLDNRKVDTFKKIKKEMFVL